MAGAKKEVINSIALCVRDEIPFILIVVGDYLKRVSARAS